MKSAAELMRASKKRFDILGGRTMAENAEWYADRVRRDANVGGLNYVPPPEREAQPSDDGDDAELLRLHLARACVPERVADVLRGGGLAETHAMTAARSWWGCGESFLLLAGETGAGKTVAACSAFLSMKRTLRWEGGEKTLWDSVGCAFETADELARLGYFSDDAHALLAHLGKVTVLVVDDLGAELMSESWRATLDALLAERFGRAHCRTVLTTNLTARRIDKDTPSPFEQRYGARIARRIRESGAVVPVDRAELAA